MYGKKNTIDDMQALAISRKGECLSTEYLGPYGKLKWRCKFKHEWESAPQNVCEKKGRPGSWCPFCSHKRGSLSIVDIKKWTESIGYKLLSAEFKGLKGYYERQCPDGHIWKSTGSHIKDMQRCPHCTIYISEEKCRFILEQLLNNEFPKTRRALGCRLELDGYCDELKLAFEYNGQQHYGQTWMRSDYIRQNDIRKAKLCEQLNIKKVDIPYYENTGIENLENFIRLQLDKLGVNIVGVVDWSKFEGCKSQLNEIARIAAEKNIKCMSTVYGGLQGKLDFECLICPWKWSTTAAILKKTVGCPKCHGNARYTIDHLREWGKEKDLILLDTEFKGMKHKHRWQCLKSHHIWIARPDMVLVRKCPKCTKIDQYPKMEFEEAKMFVRKLRLSSHKEWLEYCESERKPKNIPVDPWRVYKENYCGIGDWLGTEKSSVQLL